MKEIFVCKKERKKKRNTTGLIISTNALFSGELGSFYMFGESKNSIKSLLSLRKIIS